MAACAGPANCIGCKRRGGGMALVRVKGPSEDRPAQFPMCGTCIAAGTAIAMGGAHLRAGGHLEDLDVGPTPGEPVEAQLEHQVQTPVDIEAAGAAGAQEAEQKRADAWATKRQAN